MTLNRIRPVPDKFPPPIRLPKPFPAPPGDDVADKVVEPDDEPSESGPRSGPAIRWSAIPPETTV